MEYHFSEHHADRAERFFREELRYVEGPKMGKPFILEEWQRKIVRDLFGWLRPDGTRRYRMAYIEVPRKNGKALSVDTPVLTPQGFKRHGDLRPGDFVFSQDGFPREVQAVTEHYSGPCHAVRFSDGAEIIAHENHEWHTNRTWFTGRARGSRKPMPLIETKQISETLRCGSRGDLVHSISACSPLQFETECLSVPPYTMGIWLGDGDSACACITTADTEVVAGIEADGVSIKRRPVKYRYSLASGRRPGSVQARLRSMGVLGDKRIPENYQRASVAQRLDLLAGIVDSDGHVTAKGQCEVTLTKFDLIQDVLRLARGLGYKPTCTESAAKINGRYIGQRWRMQFHPGRELPLRIPRKRDRLRTKPVNRAGTRMIVACDPVGERVVNCIQVEGGFYLAGESLIQTHNSTFAAGIALYLLLCDKENRPQVYSAAGDRDQARIVFNMARAMIEGGTDRLKEMTRLRQYQIQAKRNSGWYEACSAEAYSAHGKNPHGILFDELHTQPNRMLWDAMLSGRGARLNSLVVAISTAGYDRQSICYEVHQRAVNAIADPDSDPTFYGVIYGADDADDWQDEAVWAKANPNLGVSVTIDFLREECQAAKDNPAHENVFRNLYLNQWTEQAVRAIPMHCWDACKEVLTEDDLLGEPCFVGLDLASTRDIAAMVAVFPRDDGKFALLPYFFSPEAAKDIRTKQDRRQFRKFMLEGDITATIGNETDYAEILGTFQRLCDKFDVRSLAYDPWNAAAFIQRVVEEGYPIDLVFKFPQTIANFAEPTGRLIALVKSGKLIHSLNPVLRWMATNTACRTDASGNLRPDKEHSADKIDGIVAAIMGLARAMLGGDTTSIYETEGSVAL